MWIRREQGESKSNRKNKQPTNKNQNPQKHKKQTINPQTKRQYPEPAPPPQKK